MNDSQFPWLILVPKRYNITELYQLDAADLAQVQNESIHVSKQLMEHFHGDKLNVAALGNVVSQLHLHHIVRFKNDISWPKPVWGTVDPAPYTDAELQAIDRELKALIF